MMHTGCPKILRSVLGLQDDNSVKELANFFQIGEILGECLTDDDHGRFKGTYFLSKAPAFLNDTDESRYDTGVHYENVGEKNKSTHVHTGFEVTKSENGTTTSHSITTNLSLTVGETMAP